MPSGYPGAKAAAASRVQVAHLVALRAHVEARHGMHFNDAYHQLVVRQNLEGEYLPLLAVLASEPAGAQQARARQLAAGPLPDEQLAGRRMPAPAGMAIPPVHPPPSSQASPTSSLTSWPRLCGTTSETSTRGASRQGLARSTCVFDI